MQENQGTAGPIEFWFDFSSPYAYFAALEIDRRLGDCGRAVLWRPYLIGVAFKVTGMSALASMPLRGEYARHDWRRIADLLGVPFVLRDDHPFPSQALARAYYWFVEREPDWAVAFAKAGFETYFGRGEDLREAADVVRLAARFTEQPVALAAWLDSDAARQVLRARTTEALDKRVFGSPFFLVDGEPFWGWDRMGMLADWVARGPRAATG